MLGDPWLPDSWPLVTTENPSLKEATVSSIMEIDKQKWDEGVIHDMFNDRDKHLILSIPLNYSTREDS